MGQTDDAGVVERYLACLAVHDWDGLAATIADEDLIREGPYCDVVEGKQRYLKFLRGVFASPEGYRLDVHRISHASDRVCYVELSETFQRPTVRPPSIRNALCSNRIPKADQPGQRVHQTCWQLTRQSLPMATAWA